MLFGIAVVAAAVMISPYVLLDIDSSRIDVTGPVHYALLVMHIFTATVALVLGPLQFVAAVRAHRRRHRLIGRAYLVLGVVPSALVGIPVALLSEQPMTRIGLLLPAMAWLVTAGLAVRAIRRGDVEAHRSWMTRNYALTFLAVTARLLVPLMLLGQLAVTGASGADLTANLPVYISFGQVAGWILNLAVAEVLIRRRRVPSIVPDIRRGGADMARITGRRRGAASPSTRCSPSARRDDRM